MAEQKVYEFGNGSTVVSVSVENKISLIRAVRGITGAGLKDSKDVVEGILRSVLVEIDSPKECSMGHIHADVQSFRVDSTVNVDGKIFVNYPSPAFENALTPVLPRVY